MALNGNFWVSLRRWTEDAWCRGGCARKRSADDWTAASESDGLRFRGRRTALAGRAGFAGWIAFNLDRATNGYCLNKRGVRVKYANHGVNNVSNQYPKSRPGQRVPAREW